MKEFDDVYNYEDFMALSGWYREQKSIYCVKLSMNLLSLAEVMNSTEVQSTKTLRNLSLILFKFVTVFAKFTESGNRYTALIVDMLYFFF